jgi:hypothetical protein
MGEVMIHDVPESHKFACERGADHALSHDAAVIVTVLVTGSCIVSLPGPGNTYRGFAAEAISQAPASAEAQYQVVPDSVMTRTVKNVKHTPVLRSSSGRDVYLFTMPHE